MLTWVIVSAYRLLRPEEPLPIEHDPAFMRREATKHGQSIPVGWREIREDQKRYLKEKSAVPYDYAGEATEALPSEWIDDLWQRRN